MLCANLIFAGPAGCRNNLANWQEDGENTAGKFANDVRILPGAAEATSLDLKVFQFRNRGLIV
jgi:hypothetical protein